jgi:hypothetical protein
MRMTNHAPISVVVLFVGLVTLAMGNRSGAAAPSATEYQPSISDLMLSIIHPRHRNLWLARQANNWDFVAYEAGNLRGAFGRVGRTFPMLGNIPLQDMMISLTEQPLRDVAAAARARDAIAFDKAYGELTEGCNACHQATNHAVVLIREPTAGMPVDQDFRPAAE